MGCIKSKNKRQQKSQQSDESKVAQLYAKDIDNVFSLLKSMLDFSRKLHDYDIDDLIKTLAQHIGDKTRCLANYVYVLQNIQSFYYDEQLSEETNAFEFHSLSVNSGLKNYCFFLFAALFYKNIGYDVKLEDLVWIKESRNLQQVYTITTKIDGVKKTLLIKSININQSNNKAVYGAELQLVQGFHQVPDFIVFQQDVNGHGQSTKTNIMPVDLDGDLTIFEQMKKYSGVPKSMISELVYEIYDVCRQDSSSYLPQVREIIKGKTGTGKRQLIMLRIEELIVRCFENNMIFPSDFKWDNVLFSPEDSRFCTCDGGQYVKSRDTCIMPSYFEQTFGHMLRWKTYKHVYKIQLITVFMYQLFFGAPKDADTINAGVIKRLCDYMRLSFPKRQYIIQILVHYVDIMQSVSEMKGEQAIKSFIVMCNEKMDQQFRPYSFFVRNSLS